MQRLCAFELEVDPRVHDERASARRGGNAAEREGSRRRASSEGAIRVLFSDNRAQDRRGGDFDVRQKCFRPIAAMEQHAFVVVVGIVIVPIHQRTR